MKKFSGILTIIVLFIFVLASATPLTCSTTEEELSTKIHKDAWSKFVSQAKSDAYLKYAIYACRTLAVKHPEVYLQGDDILSEILTTIAGFKEAYETKNVHSSYLYYDRSLWNYGSPFSFDDVDFTGYRLVSCRELYPENCPFLLFLDRRLDHITTTLKTFDGKITQLEKAEQLYFAGKKKSYKELYLIYCDNENSCLYQDGSLISAKEQEVIERPEGNPILIFNEDNVWYPLMERDDTHKSQVLKELVTKYSTEVNKPELSAFEQDLIAQLKEVSEFENARSLVYLRLACINLGRGSVCLLPQKTREELQRLNLPYFLWCERALNEKMSLFSPISAYLAAIVKEREGKAGVEAMCNEHAKYTRTPGHGQSHGHIWACNMVEYGIEHAYRCRAGHCVVQAAAIDAALKLAGIDSYRLAGFSISEDGFGLGHHDSIYVPLHDLIISNGNMLNEGGTVICDDFKYLDFIEHDEKWAYLTSGGLFYGTLSPNETIEILDYLRGIHNDDIQNCRWENGKLVKVPYEQAIKEQDALERWQPYEMPPYALPLANELLLSWYYLPSIEIASSVCDYYGSGEPIVLEAQAKTYGGREAHKVEFIVDDITIGSDTDPPYAFTWTEAVNGRHSIKAKVYDSEDSTSESPPVTIFVGIRALERSIMRFTDDAEEEPEDGSMYLDSSDLELVNDGQWEQVVGMRFRDIRLPREAQIKKAYLQFTVDEIDTEQTELRIYAELAANAGTFTEARHNISSRERTSASVEWAPVPWEVTRERSEKQRTPDLSALIQEVIAQPDWQEGNAIVFMINGIGERTAESFDGDQQYAPVLYIEY